MALRRTGWGLALGLWVACLSPAALGCNSPDGSSHEPILNRVDSCLNEPPPEGGAAVILGTSVDGAFAELMPNQALTLHFGPQGGQHVYVSVKLWSDIQARWVDRFDFFETPANVHAGGVVAVVEACASKWTLSENTLVYIDRKDSKEGVLRLESSIQPDLGSMTATTSVPITIVQE